MISAAKWAEDMAISSLFRFEAISGAMICVVTKFAVFSVESNSVFEFFTLILRTCPFVFG